MSSTMRFIWLLPYLLGGAVHKRSERTRCRARGNCCCLRVSFVTTNFLLDRLIQPCLNTSSPLLVEVLERNNYERISQEASSVNIISQYMYSQMWRGIIDIQKTLKTPTNRCCASPWLKIPRYMNSSSTGASMT